jgi:hypothetical protein
VPVQTPTQVVELIADHSDGFASVFRRMRYVPFLQLLELSHDVVTKDLRREFLDCGLTESDFRSVSLSELIVFALRSPSRHWASLAIQWLAEGFPIDAAIAQAGDDMIQAKRGSQADRHSLFRMLRRWERAK